LIFIFWGYEVYGDFKNFFMFVRLKCGKAVDL